MKRPEAHTVDAHRPLTPADLFPAGPRGRLGRNVFIHSTIDSTNLFLLNHAATAGDGAVAWAEHQTAGRGRLGRRWEAPRGSSILLSVLLIQTADSPLLSRATLLAALAACEAIETRSEARPAIRWPNDVILNDRKVGGVLAESRPITKGGQRALVIGVGLNCLQQPGHFAGELATRATSLEIATTHPVQRGALAAALLQRMDHWLDACASDASAWPLLRRAWLGRCDDIGKRVHLHHDSRSFSGTALDISEAGDLIVQLEHGGRRHFAAANTTRTA